MVLINEKFSVNVKKNKPPPQKICRQIPQVKLKQKRKEQQYEKD